MRAKVAAACMHAHMLTPVHAHEPEAITLLHPAGKEREEMFHHTYV